MVYYSSSKKAACLPSFWKDLISVVGHGHHTTKSARKILVLGGSRHHQSCVLQQHTVRCRRWSCRSRAYLLRAVAGPYAAGCCRGATKETGSSRRRCRRRRGRRRFSLPYSLSLLRLKIGGSFDGHALNAAAARRQASKAASTSSAKIHAGSTVSSLKPARQERSCSVLLMLLPATDEIRPTTATQPTAKSS